jgi:hypothetical protein
MRDVVFLTEIGTLNPTLGRLTALELPIPPTLLRRKAEWW